MDKDSLLMNLCKKNSVLLIHYSDVILDMLHV